MIEEKGAWGFIISLIFYFVSPLFTQPIFFDPGTPTEDVIVLTLLIAIFIVWPIAWVLLFILEKILEEADMRRRIRQEHRLNQYGDRLVHGRARSRPSSRQFEEEQARFHREEAERARRAHARSYLPQNSGRSYEEPIEPDWQEGEWQPGDYEPDEWKPDYQPAERTDRKRLEWERNRRLPRGGWDD